VVNSAGIRQLLPNLQLIVNQFQAWTRNLEQILLG